MRKLEEYNRKLELFHQMSESLPVRQFRSEADQLMLRQKNKGLINNKYKSDKIGEIYKRIQTLRAQDEQNSKKYSENGEDFESNLDENNETNPGNFERKSHPENDFIDKKDSKTNGDNHNNFLVNF